MGLYQEYLIMILIVFAWLFLGFMRPVEPAAVMETTAMPSNSTTPPPLTVKVIEKEMEGLITMVSKMALPYFVRNSDLKISPSCMSTVIKMFMDVRKLKLPVVKLLDAMAKPPVGLLRGTFGIMGDYDECLDVRANKKGYVPRPDEAEFYHGQYCVVQVDFPTVIVDAIDDYNTGKVNVSVFGKLGDFINEFAATTYARNYFKYKIGICMPSTCSEADLQEMITLVPVSFIPIQVKHCDDGRQNHLKVDQAVFIAFMVLFGAMILCGTALEGYFYLKYSTFKGDHKDKFIQFFLAFSLYGNTKKLLNTERNTDGAPVIPVVNGMYVMGTVLVVIYHTYCMPFFLEFSSHGATLGEYFEDVHFTLISTMAISIEAYFLFSGLFLSYRRFHTDEKEVRVNVIQTLVRRYLRLCPSMLVVLGIIVFLQFIGSGPIWSEIFGVAAENTRRWWWTYVLMFNNFLAVKNQNFLYLWFIPCLMQITIIGTILLWIISKSRKFGIALTVLTGLGCNIALGVLTAYRHYPPTYAIYYYHNREYYEETIYTSPLSHVFSYLIGILLGIFMAKNPSLKFSKAHVIFGWIISLFLTIGIQYLMYFGRDGLEPDPILSAIYAGTHRTLFSIGLSWIVLACTHGYGGVFTKIMGWKGFAVLSKLGYFGYLIHYIVITFHVSYARMPLMYSHYEVLIRFCAYTTLTFAAAYVLYVTFEAPLVFIESLFLPTSTSGTDFKNNINSQSKDKPDILAVKYNDILTPNIQKSSWNETTQPNSDAKENGEQSKL